MTLSTPPAPTSEVYLAKTLYLGSAATVSGGLTSDENTGIFNFGGKSIQGVGEPTDNNHAATKYYADNKFNDVTDTQDAQQIELDRLTTEVYGVEADPINIGMLATINNLKEELDAQKDKFEKLLILLFKTATPDILS